MSTEQNTKYFDDSVNRHGVTIREAVDHYHLDVNVHGMLFAKLDLPKSKLDSFLKTNGIKSLKQVDSGHIVDDSNREFYRD